MTVDHSHNDFAVTTVDGNPITANYQGLSVTSIFKRTMNRRRKGVGDNSPILYAFKGMHGLRTQYGTVASLTANFYQILDKFLEQRGEGWDLIIPVPSSHQIANIVAKRVMREVSGATLEVSALRKVSAGQVKSQVRGLQIKSKDKSQLGQYVNRFIKYNGVNVDFQMKSITDPKLRKHINPVSFGSLNARTPPMRVLLVDDMVTSGTSLNFARQAIVERYPLVEVHALTLLSSSK